VQIPYTELHQHRKINATRKEPYLFRDFFARQIFMKLELHLYGYLLRRGCFKANEKIHRTG
jgi:hypothetical protein